MIPTERKPSADHPRKRRVTGLLAGSQKIAIYAAVAGLVTGTAVAARPGDVQPFVEASRAAMDRMMAGMDTKPSGDVDSDFVAMMIPHHQGAIDMAVAELRFGKDEHLKRIAQEIIVDQQQEIAAMRLALGQPLPPSIPAPTTPISSHAMHMEQ